MGEVHAGKKSRFILFCIINNHTDDYDEGVCIQIKKLIQISYQMLSKQQLFKEWFPSTFK